MRQRKKCRHDFRHRRRDPTSLVFGQPPNGLRVESTVNMQAVETNTPPSPASLPSPPRRRRPSLATSVNELKRAGLHVSSVRVTVDGEYVFVVGEDREKSANPWDQL
jgi:hypothetical protein